MDFERVDGKVKFVGIILQALDAAVGSPLDETIAATEGFVPVLKGDEIVRSEGAAAVVVNAEFIAARFDGDVAHDAGSGGFVIAGVEQEFLESGGDGACFDVDVDRGVVIVSVFSWF